MATHTFDEAAFRAMFPDFASDTTYPDAMLASYWAMAVLYITADDSWMIEGDTLQFALNLMVAHLGKSYSLINAGQSTSVVQSSSVGSVSVSMVPPPVKTGWQHWLCTTPYGAQLWALLQSLTVGGIYIGGSQERQGFRKVGGVF